jgi:hypothetical protein
VALEIQLPQGNRGGWWNDPPRPAHTNSSSYLRENGPPKELLVLAFLIILIVVELILIWAYSPGPVDAKAVNEAMLAIYADVVEEIFMYEPPLLELFDD